MDVEQARTISKNALEELAQALERGKSDEFLEYLATLGRFHRYSPRNVMLIRYQRPESTQVAGFSTWARLGRSIMPGERGIAILAPIPRRALPAPEECEDNEENKRDRKELDLGVVGFRTAYVFDIEQTTGAPLPEPPRVGGDPGRFLQRLERFVANKQITLEYGTGIAPARGVSAGGRIILLPNMTAAEQFSVLSHELAHELLHDRDARRDPKAAQLRELEAEAVAYVVCQGIGLETGTASADYILHYDGDRAALSRSLERIQRTASEILTAISDI